MKAPYAISTCEYLRLQAKQKFERVKESMIECGRWTLPHRTRVLLAQQEGERNNKHIVDGTHILALRSHVAGFLEGNTSASRPWYRVGHGNPDIDKNPENREWLDFFTRRTFNALSTSNFYHAAGSFYYDNAVFNTGAHYIEELGTRLHFHTLTPGTYFCLNDNFGSAGILIREFSLTVKALVDAYGKKKPDGNWDWSNFSSRVVKLYQESNYTQMISVIHVIKPNDHFDKRMPISGLNKQWISLHYELAGPNGTNYQVDQEAGNTPDPRAENKYLRVVASKRKPFIVGKGDSSENFEYGEKGPTLDALGAIKSLNKKAIGKDIALDQMLKPAVQGPASLRKSYITTAPNSFVPLDAQSAAAGGLKPVFQVNPAIAALNQDVSDLRGHVDKHYLVDYLLYLSMNPKTRTATETNAVVQEQQLVIGPMLQSLNWTYNNPIVEFIMDWVLDNDPYLPPAPKALQGQFLKTEFISVFAQAQKAADLPVIDKFIEMAERVGQMNPKIWDKVNLDKLADIYEDRLYLPAGLNNPQSKVDAMREQAAMQAQRQQILNETVPAIAGAQKDLSQVNQA